MLCCPVLVFHCAIQMENHSSLDEVKTEESLAKGRNVWMTEKNKQTRWWYVELRWLLPDTTLCFLERRHVDRLSLRVKTIQNLTTCWAIFRAEVRAFNFGASTGSLQTNLSINFIFLLLAQVVWNLLSPILFLHFFCFVTIYLSMLAIDLSDFLARGEYFPRLP